MWRAVIVTIMNMSVYMTQSTSHYITLRYVTLRYVNRLQLESILYTVVFYSIDVMLLLLLYHLAILTRTEALIISEFQTIYPKYFSDNLDPLIIRK